MERTHRLGYGSLVKAYMLISLILVLVGCESLVEKTPITIGFEDCSQELDQYSLVTTVGNEDRIYIHADQLSCGGKTTVCQARSLEQVTVEAPTEFVQFQDMVTVNRDLVYFPYRALQEGEERISFNVSTTDGTEVLHLDLKVITQGYLSVFGECKNLSSAPQDLIVMEGTYDLVTNDWIDVNEEAYTQLPALSASDSSLVSLSNGERLIDWMCREESMITFSGLGETELLFGDDLPIARLSVVDQYDGYLATKYSTEGQIFETVCLTKTLGSKEICYSTPVDIQVVNNDMESCDLISVDDDDLPTSMINIRDDCFDIRMLTDQPCQFTISSDQQVFPITIE